MNVLGRILGEKFFVKRYGFSNKKYLVEERWEENVNKDFKSLNPRSWSPPSNKDILVNRLNRNTLLWYKENNPKVSPIIDEHKDEYLLINRLNNNNLSFHKSFDEARDFAGRLIK
jgi:hypothetical protein